MNNRHSGSNYSVICLKIGITDRFTDRATDYGPIEKFLTIRHIFRITIEEKLPFEEKFTLSRRRALVRASQKFTCERC